jgi:hypothetical protein
MLIKPSPNLGPVNPRILILIKKKMAKLSLLLIKQCTMRTFWGEGGGTARHWTRVSGQPQTANNFTALLGYFSYWYLYLCLLRDISIDIFSNFQKTRLVCFLLFNDAPSIDAIHYEEEACDWTARKLQSRFRTVLCLFSSPLKALRRGNLSDLRKGCSILCYLMALCQAWRLA